MHTQLLLMIGLILLTRPVAAQLVEEERTPLPEESRLTSTLPDEKQVDRNLYAGNYADTIQALCILAAGLPLESLAALAWEGPAARRLEGGFLVHDFLPYTCSTVNLRVELLADPDKLINPERLMEPLALGTGQRFKTPEEWIRWWDLHWRAYTAPAWPATAPERLAAFRARVERMKAPWPRDLAEADVLKASENLRATLGRIAGEQYVWIRPTFDAEGRETLEAALKSYHGGDSARAEQVLTAYLETHPRDINARVCRAFARTDQRKPRESQEDLDAARMLFTETSAPAGLRRLNERLLSQPGESLSQAYSSLNEQPRGGWEHMDLGRAKNALYERGLRELSLYSPGDEALAALAHAHRGQPLRELGFLLLLEDLDEGVPDLARRHPDLTEAWLHLFLSQNFMFKREQRLLALQQLRRLHPEDTYLRLQQVMYEEYHRFFCGKKTGTPLKLSEESRALLRMEKPAYAFPEGPDARLYEVQRLAAMEAGLGGVHSLRALQWLPNILTPYANLVNLFIIQDQSLRGLTGSDTSLPLDVPRPKAANQDPADLRLIAETYHAAACHFMNQPRANLVHYGTALGLDTFSMEADILLETEYQQPPPAERVATRQRLLTAVVAELVRQGHRDVPPLPGLAKELCDRLLAPLVTKENP